MSTSFGILFSVKIAHSYYSGNCQDFDFIIPRDCSDKARNCRMIIRIFNGILYVLTEKQSDGSPLVSAHGQTFRFGLRLKNPFFSNFTQLDFPAGSIPLYSNVSAVNQLDAGSAVFMTGPLFSHSISRVNRPVTITLKDNAQNEILNKVLTDPLVTDPLPVDLRDYPYGLYQLTEKYASITKKFGYYLDPELITSNLFGLLEIKADTSFYSPTPPEFQVAFTAKEEVLKYYVVGKKYTAAELNNVLVSDAGFNEESRPQVVFTRVNQNNFTANDLPPTLLADSTSKVVLFKSQGLVRRLEKPRKKIQLSKSTDLIIKHLPQPSIEQSNSDMIIQISKP
ncbi:MAG: hypothetical protein IPH45_12080 [Bacteroidales bacterium]|nr:hypothetical protein [Bacteroidales bacterium]